MYHSHILGAYNYSLQRQCACPSRDYSFSCIFLTRLTNMQLVYLETLIFLQTYQLSGMLGVVRARFLCLADRLQTYLCAIPTKTVCEVSCGGTLLIHKQQTGE